MTPANVGIADKVLYGSRNRMTIMAASTILAIGPSGIVHSPLIATYTK